MSSPLKKFRIPPLLLCWVFMYLLSTSSDGEKKKERKKMVVELSLFESLVGRIYQSLL